MQVVMVTAYHVKFDSKKIVPRQANWQHTILSRENFMQNPITKSKCNQKF